LRYLCEDTLEEDPKEEITPLMSRIISKRTKWSVK